ncbi:MAG: BrnT family toxin [Acidobacteriota bacterium]
MRFTWDEAKNLLNRRKHGIGFDTAIRVFLDPLHFTRLDRVVDGEERWQTIGSVDGWLLILVAYTVIDEDQEWLRIISARRATRQERIDYEEALEI